MSYKELESKPEVSKMQNNVLEYWSKNRIFEKSLTISENNEKVFYDGPPFPTGKPHHGTVLVSFIKDMIARYWTMRGYKVPRVWGWDCHGLPIENQVETLLGIQDKNEIEKKIGIEAFNNKCYELVSNNNDQWKEYVEQMARWVDYDGAYKTMNLDFMESVIWAFKQCYDKGLIYRDYRVTPYCMHCETSLSISDTRESDSTRLRQDRWIIVQFKSNIDKFDKDVYLLAWTTTPWTLPSNMCLAVGEKLTYSFVDVGDRILVACKNTLSNFKKVFGENPNIVYECLGSELLGTKYTPLFPYFADKAKEGAFRVISADYVGSEEGVGIVHTAPAFGEDDYWACKNNNVPLVNPVDAKGQFTPEIKDFYEIQGDKNVIDMNPIIIKFLYANGSAVADGTIEHNYPHCWRCKRPLIYKAMDAYYFNIGKIKDRLIELNESINWVPETIKHGRFGNWLENARDWNISRNRYWSTPIPIWECPHCNNKKVLGSIDEIYKESGIKLNNLHRQYMDKVTIKCDKCGETMTRVPEVLDCWFESGSVPFAQKHYPFENKEWFDNHFPCDFIVEYTGQIRCWFYYLHVLAVALFDKPAYQNCIVHGTILAKDGKKLSKSSKNYTDPMELMKKYGTDSFRLYLYQSKAMLIGDLLFDESGLQDAYQKLILPFWNACNFFISYANIDGFCYKEAVEPTSDDPLDTWILAKLYDTESHIRQNMDKYQIDKYVEYMVSLVDGITNWYIRRSRKKFWGNEFTKTKKDAYETLYYVLYHTTKLFAPIAPIIAEKIFKSLTDKESVHLEPWTEIPAKYKNDELIKRVDVVQNVIGLARSIRNKNKVKNRQPLSTLNIASSNKEIISIVDEFKSIIQEEINVKNIVILDKIEDIATIQYLPNFNSIKDLYPTEISQIIKAVKSGKFEYNSNEVICEIDGVKKSYSPEIILVNYKAKEGFFVASDREVVISLDLNITKELKDEGVAREIVRSIQDARKQIGCMITDKIKIELSGDYPENWINYICNETLSSVAKIEKADIELDVNADDTLVHILVAK